VIDTIINAVGGRALLIIVAALMVVLIALSVRNGILSVRLDAAQAKNKTQTVQLAAIGQQISAQNNAVDQMLANAAQQAERLKAASAAAGKVQDITGQRIKYVDRAAIPTACIEAITWGAGHAVEIGRQWEGERE
jgi:hypothetical protein